MPCAKNRHIPTWKRIGLGACLGLIVCFTFNAAVAAPEVYDFMVAQDGSGDFTTVQAAFDAVADNQKTPTVIFVRNGVYKEKIVLAEEKKRVTLIGEDRDQTVLTYDDYTGKIDASGHEIIPADTASFTALGNRFCARRITFANPSGPVGQAIAVAVKGDQSRFLNCRFLGYQDTIYTAGSRQYFKQCQIEGAVDFIFGPSTAVFDQCTLVCTGLGYITAASTPRKKPYGYVFKHCTITGSAPEASVFLGRPWRAYAKTVFIHCLLGRHIRPDGWDDWDDPTKEDTAYFAEYENAGEGAHPESRVEWSNQLEDEEAGEYTLKKILGDAEDDLKSLTPWYKDW